MISRGAIAIESAGGRDVPIPRSPLGWTNANIPGSSMTGCADADDEISASTKAAPKNLNLVIGLLLIIDPRTAKWIVREQDQHRCGDIPFAAITLRRP